MCRGAESKGECDPAAGREALAVSWQTWSTTRVPVWPASLQARLLGHLLFDPIRPDPGGQGEGNGDRGSGFQPQERKFSLFPDERKNPEPTKPFICPSARGQTLHSVTETQDREPVLWRLSLWPSRAPPFCLTRGSSGQDRVPFTLYSDAAVSAHLVPAQPLSRQVFVNRCASGAAPPLWPRPPPAQVHKPEVRSPPRCRVAGGPGPRCSRSGAPWKLGPWRHQPNFQPMATPGLGLLWVLGLALLPTRWGRAWGENSTSTPASLTQEPNDFSSNGGLSQEGLTAIIVVFSILGALVVVSGLVFMVQKLREKRQTEGTYRPSNEEQFSHAAEARAPQDSKETVRGCLPI